MSYSATTYPSKECEEGRHNECDGFGHMLVSQEALTWNELACCPCADCAHTDSTATKNRVVLRQIQQALLEAPPPHVRWYSGVEE